MFVDLNQAALSSKIEQTLATAFVNRYIERNSINGSQFYNMNIFFSFSCIVQYAYFKVMFLDLNLAALFSKI